MDRAASRLLRPVPAGGRLRVVSVAGKVDAELFERGLDALRQRGFEVAAPTAPIAGSHPYLAASHQERLADFVDAISDPSADAILCARGGFGSMHLVRGAQMHIPARWTRPFVGFSDITALHLTLNQRGIATFHGPVVTALGCSTFGAHRADDLVAALTGTCDGEAVFRGDPDTSGGSVSGVLVGGNLSLLSACLPARECAAPAGTICLIEEVNEAPYRVDRMLSGLALAGCLDGFAGFALGSFTGCGDDSEALVGLLRERLVPLGVPIVSGLPFGHGELDRTVPLGVPATLDANAGVLTVRMPTVAQ